MFAVSLSACSRMLIDRVKLIALPKTAFLEDFKPTSESLQTRSSLDSWTKPRSSKVPLTRSWCPGIVRLVLSWGSGNQLSWHTQYPCSSTPSGPCQEPHINCSHFPPDAYTLCTLATACLPHMAGHDPCATCCSVSLLHTTTDAQHFLESGESTWNHGWLWFYYACLNFRLSFLTRTTPLLRLHLISCTSLKLLLSYKDKVFTQTLVRDPKYPGSMF